MGRNGSERSAEDGTSGDPTPDDRIYAAIHDAIGSQELPPGTRLREDEMRRIFGVSRARIRKVFARLAYAGLLTIEPNRGASVFRPTPREAREIFAARRGVEGMVVRMLAGKLAKEDRAQLKRHIAAEERAEAARNWTEMVKLSGDFHLRLAEIAGNSLLLRFLRELVSREALVILVYEKPGKPSCSHHEHQLILDAILADDADRAAGLMDEHLANIEERLELDREGPKPVDLARLFGGRGLVD